MPPSKEELEKAFEDENRALLAYATSLKKGERAELEIIANREKLRHARHAKAALMNDMNCFVPKIKSKIPMKV